MPAFSLDLLLRHLVIMHVAGVAVVLGLCAAVPAFVAAANPRTSGQDPKRRVAIVVALAIFVLLTQLFVNDAVVWTPVLGALIGLLVRWFAWIRTHWLPLAIFTAAALGVVQFSGLQYSTKPCWP